MYLLVRILVLPRQVFDEIRETTPYRLPLSSILLVGFVCVALVLIQFDGAIIHAIQEDGSTVPVVHYFFFFELLLAPFFSLWFSIVSLVILLTWTTYFWLMGIALKSYISWRNWFGFTCWTSVPTILGSIGGLGILKFLSSDPSFESNSYPVFGWFGMNYLSVFWVPIPLVWSLYIAVNGFISWTGKSLTTIMLVVLTPPIALVLLRAFTKVPIIAEFVHFTSF